MVNHTLLQVKVTYDRKKNYSPLFLTLLFVFHNLCIACSQKNSHSYKHYLKVIKSRSDSSNLNLGALILKANLK